ncbi:MAG: GGDEF domain-containing protein [Treponema sp.]|nr:GGDEF domain-containing protein [Treponema sp.]
MTRIQFLFIKNRELLIYLILFLLHFLAIPVYQHLISVNEVINLHPILIYNTGISFVYLCFIILFKNLKNKFFILLAYFETLTYCIFFTVTMGSDFGLQIVPICVIPCVYLLGYSARASLKFYITFGSLAFFVNIFILYWNFMRNGIVSTNAYYIVSLELPVFYIWHTIMLNSTAMIVHLYISIHTEMSFRRSRQKNKQIAQELDYISNHDHLTGLLNRRKINFYIEPCSYRKKTENADYAFTIFDIESFKKVNDTYGHDAGDFILKNISSKISQYIKPGQLLARWGGEEFVILFKDFSPEIRNQLELIREEVSRTDNVFNGINIKITLTFGLSSSRTSTSPDRLIMEADNNLMYGKEHGKNQVVVSESFK